MRFDSPTPLWYTPFDKGTEMATTKIRLEQIENGRILKQLVLWFRASPQAFPARLNALRARTRSAARRAGITLKDVDHLIAEVRSRRAKT